MYGEPSSPSFRNEIPQFLRAFTSASRPAEKHGRSHSGAPYRRSLVLQGTQRARYRAHSHARVAGAIGNVANRRRLIIFAHQARLITSRDKGNSRDILEWSGLGLRVRCTWLRASPPPLFLLSSGITKRIPREWRNASQTGNECQGDSLRPRCSEALPQLPQCRSRLATTLVVMMIARLVATVDL